MTVGIALTNRQLAFAIADAQATSSNNRIGNGHQKLAVIENDVFSGVVFGSGDANMILGELQIQPEERITSDEYMQQLQQGILERNLTVYDAYAESARRIIESQARALGEEERSGFIAQRTSETLQDIKQQEQKDASTSLVGVTYEGDRIRTFSLNQRNPVELFYNPLTIGSGADSAHLHLTAKLQGVDSSQLSEAQLVYLGVTGYSASTINVGVGGTPTGARIRKGCVTTVQREDIITLCNLGSEHLARPHDYTGREFMEDIELVLTQIDNKDPRDYVQLGNRVDRSSKDISTSIIPYISILERANRALFHAD